MKIKNQSCMKTVLIPILFIFILFGCKNPSHDELFIKGVSEPEISLNGEWRISINPPEEYYKREITDTEWRNIMVPGECTMQGFAIKHDHPFVYFKEFLVPDDYNGHNIKLRFEGVYNYARVWINGEFIREHYGGFTSWNCDITDHIIPGEIATLFIEVTDRADGISYGSGYAKHQIGGILGDVRLLAVPQGFPENIIVNVDFDNNYKDAFLNINIEFKHKLIDTKIKLELFDDNNKSVELGEAGIPVDNLRYYSITKKINNPEKWDSEHPNLYQLRVSGFYKGKKTWAKTIKLGFREIEIRGNKLYINGDKVKLRGACRHDVHPLLGRVSTLEYELLDVKLAKESNMNFIRTSHYPPTDRFLELCDEYGIYVEDESAVCFVGSHRTEEYYPGDSQSDSAFTGRYMSQVKEMVNNHRNHPSVIIWSVGNENYYGFNFQKSYDWIKEKDPYRPVMYSYPGGVPDSIRTYDILSMHYPSWEGNLDQWGIQTQGFNYESMPVLFDEWAHVACYNKPTLLEDPNVRDFWGRSLDKMWAKCYESDGGLGGAIWGYIDETFMLPDTLSGYNKWWGKSDKKVIPGPYEGHTVGYGEWGIIDTWRRKKPEFWNVKKAYSPVKVLQTEFENIAKTESLQVPVFNRFNHTNFNELNIEWEYKGKIKKLNPVDLEPGKKGNLIIGVNNWEARENIKVSFKNGKNELIDIYELQLNPVKPDKKDILSGPDNSEVRITEHSNNIVVSTDGLIIEIDKKTGLLGSIFTSDNKYSFRGPYLNMRTIGKAIIYSSNEIEDFDKSWILNKIDHELKNNIAHITISGTYSDTIEVIYNLEFTSAKLMKTRYRILNPSGKLIRELGVKYIVENVYTGLSWNRKTYWTIYPENHLSAPIGEINLYPKSLLEYRKKPIMSWQENYKSFYYNGLSDKSSGIQLLYEAKATKENIYSYSLNKKKNKPIFTVKADGDVACRLNRLYDELVLYISNIWDYVDLSWGNFQNNIKLQSSYENEVIIGF